MLKNRITKFGLIGLLLLSALYFGFRYRATIIADREIDLFFAEFGSPQEGASNLHFANQTQEIVAEILRRHQSAITNFEYENHIPRLNIGLNKTRIDVSWNLSIVFERHSGYWHPALFKEFSKKDDNDLQGH